MHHEVCRPRSSHSAGCFIKRELLKGSETRKTGPGALRNNCFPFFSCASVFFLHAPLCEDVRSPATAVTNRCELPCECWELHVGPLEEQSVLLTTEPSLLLLPSGFTRACTPSHDQPTCMRFGHLCLRFFETSICLSVASRKGFKHAFIYSCGCLCIVSVQCS